MELNDESTLDSYGVPDSASLKLVVSMKGGPVKIRRIPVGAVDPAWVEMRDLIEISEYVTPKLTFSIKNDNMG